MEENENERNPFQCMILVSLILLTWNDPRISSKTFRSPRFFMKALGRHAEHWAAISVEGWQITVPIWDSGGRVEANLLICKKGRKVVINYLSQLSVRNSCLSAEIFCCEELGSCRAARNNFANETIKWNEREKLCAKKLKQHKVGDECSVLAMNE